MPPAARITDMHTCPMVTPGVPPIPHVGGPILPPGCPTVLIGFLPAARVSDMAVCVGPPDVIAKGSPTVLIGSMMAARIGDLTAHGGVIVMGCPTVIIGEAGGGGGGGGGGPSANAPAPTAPTQPTDPAQPDGSAGGGDSGSTSIKSGKVNLKKPPQKPAAPRTEQKTGCRLISLTILCGHVDSSRKPHVIEETTPPEKRWYGVVPGQESQKMSTGAGVKGITASKSGMPRDTEDKVELLVQDKCATCKKQEHPSWSLGGESVPRGTRKHTHAARSWTTGKSFPWIPDDGIARIQPVSIQSCENNLAAYLRVYPCDKLDVKFDLLTIWSLFTDVLEKGLRGAAGKWASDIISSMKASDKALAGQRKAALRQAGKDAAESREERDKKPGGKLARKAGMTTYELTLEGQISAQWKEYIDHRAYYEYDYSITGGVSGGWEYRFSLIACLPGMAWYQSIPQDVRAKLADAYVFIGIGVSGSIKGSAQRGSPDKPLADSGSLQATITPKVSAGGGAVIADGKVLSVRVSGESGIEFKGTGGIDRVGLYLQGEIGWTGLDVAVKAAVVDDFIVLTDSTYNLCKPVKWVDERADLLKAKG